MTSTFHYTLQLVQLKILDPAAHKAANIALRSEFVFIAAQIVVEAMQAALTRLVAQSRANAHRQPATEIGRKYRQVTPQPQPKCRCNAYLRTFDSTGGPYLKRCQKLARYQLTLQSDSEPYVIFRCESCKNELHAKIKNSATFEILAEVELVKDEQV